MSREKLAIFGGTPVRTTPFPERRPYDEADVREVTEAVMSQNLFMRPDYKIAQFESEFAAKYGVAYAATGTSGTSVLHMAIAAVDAEPGDEVIVSPVTDFGTVCGVLHQGLIPVIADWAPGTLNTDPADIERKITGRTRAIIVVHLFGTPCDMDAIMAVARKHNIVVIEDCCQAYLTYYKGKLVGTIGDMGCFSMQETKHLPVGEGGVAISNNPEFARKMKLFRDKGFANRYEGGPRAYVMLAMNYRMNEVTGALALSQLRKVEATVEKMTRLGNLLTERIKDIDGITVAPTIDGCTHSYWAYPFYITGFDTIEFVNALQAEGIEADWGYTKDPIYTCMLSLCEHKTFGNSGYPLVSQYRDEPVTYSKGLCPVAERELKILGDLRFEDSWSEQDIEDVAQAFHKVAEGLRK